MHRRDESFHQNEYLCRGVIIHPVLKLNYFLEYEYYKYRFKGGTPEEVESLIFPLFYLCGLDEIIEKHWISLDYQESNYKKLSG